MRSEKFDNLIILILLAATVTILLAHHFSLNRTLTIDSNTSLPIKTITDQSTGRGKSQASFSKTNDHLLLDCQIVESDYAWPFCELAISLAFDDDGKLTKPMDLSTFTEVKISAKYDGNLPNGIRFYLRAYNERYASYQDENSWKYNAIEYWPESNDYPVTIPMKSLQVATWWMLEQEIPIRYSAPEFDQIMVIEIATASGISPGDYKIIIERIEFKGKVFSNRAVFISIIIMWVAAAVVSLIINLRRSRFKLTKALRKAKELRQLNRLLNVESQALKDRVERDPLTGALNRSGIETLFTDEIKIISLIFIDIDHFKRINDNYGHSVGDDILVEFTKLISENCRSTDFLARWGGEEFLLVCPNTKLNEAQELAEDIRLLIVEKVWTHQIRLTSSFGVAQRLRESAADFIERADQALYTAKARGRNTVVVSHDSNIDSSISF